MDGGVYAGIAGVSEGSEKGSAIFKKRMLSSRNGQVFLPISIHVVFDHLIYNILYRSVVKSHLRHLTVYSIHITQIYHMVHYRSFPQITIRGKIWFYNNFHFLFDNCCGLIRFHRNWTFYQGLVVLASMYWEIMKFNNKEWNFYSDYKIKHSDKIK